MAAIKAAPRSALTAFAPDAPYLAAGTMAGTIDPSFNSTASLEIHPLDFASDSPDLPVAASISSDERFHRLSWSSPAHASDDYALGLIAGGHGDGTITVWNPKSLLSSDLEGAVVAKLERHTGPVRGLEFNPRKPNQLVSGADGGELYTMAGTIDPSFNSTHDLELFHLDFASGSPDLPAAASIPFDEHFHRLAWSSPAHASDDYALGLVADAPYLAAGTMADTIDPSFNSTHSLEIFALDFTDFPLAAAISSDERFHRLSWSLPADASNDFAVGLVAGGHGDGTIDPSFNSTANLEIYALDFSSDSPDLPLAAAIPFNEGFRRLPWDAG